MLYIYWVLSFTILVFTGSFIVKQVIIFTRKKLKQNANKNLLISYLGFFELFTYSFSLVISRPEFIAVWLGVKSLNRWKVETKNDEVNIFLFGSLLNVIFSFLIGLVALKIGISWNIISYNSNLFFSPIFR